MPEIYFLPVHKKAVISEQTTIPDAARQLNIPLDAPCGGNGKCRKCLVTVNGKNVPACQTRITEDTVVTIPQMPCGMKILADSGAASPKPDPVADGAIHMAVDLGTTTVVCYCLDAESGKVLGTESMLNPQYPYGSDVTSRIQKACAGQLLPLSQCVREGIWTLVCRLCRRFGKSPEQIGTLCVVGNPCMQQLFLGLAADNLMRPPFSPKLTVSEVLPLGKIFPVISGGKLLTIPDISGYVGADTLGCVYSSGMYKTEKITLLVDIGTNGELVLGNRHRMMACSTAAGPALEGGKISHGMRGAFGAIDHLWSADGRIRFSVIGDTAPRGICGSGLIDATATMLELGILNKRGRIVRDYQETDHDRYWFISENICLSQKDIREVQLAKAAICAGIHILAKAMEITLEDIDTVLLCGAFGTYMDTKNACRIGLLPDGLLPKIHIMGNAAGAGCCSFAVSKNAFLFADMLAQTILPLELSTVPEFQTAFTRQTRF